MAASIHLRIADVGIAVDLGKIRLDPESGRYEAFLAGSPGVDIRLSVLEGPEPPPRPSQPVFEIPGHWQLYRESDRQILEIWDPLLGRPTRVANLSGDLSEGVLTLGPEGRIDRQGRTICERPRRRRLATLLDPLLRILMVDRIGREDGLMLHAAAFDLDGIGIVFAGPSGAGKSTLSRLFAKHRPDAAVIGDEHIVLRRQGGCWTVHGTPWPGEGFMVSPGGVPLGRVYLIHHDTGNRAYPQRASTSFAELLAQAFLPRWNPEALHATISRIGDLAQDWAEKLGFVNRPEVIEYIRSQALTPAHGVRHPSSASGRGETERSEVG